MPNVYTETQKFRKYVPLLPLWYQENPIETALFAGNLNLLSKDILSYKDGIAGITKHSKISENGQDIFWDFEDRRTQPIAITAATNATTFDVASVPVNLIPGTKLFNKETGETGIVSNITGTTITLLAPGFVSPLYAAGNNVLDSGYAKPYGVDAGKRSIRNDYTSYSNHIQIVERQLDTDMFESNKSLLNMEVQERQKEKISDLIRDEMFNVMHTFYFGRQGARVIGGETYHYAGGLDEFVLPQHKFVINVATAHSIRASVMQKVRLAHQSGVPNIYKSGRMVLVCTTKMVEKLSLAFGDAIVYNDEFKDYKVEMTTIRQNGFKLTRTPSTFLDHMVGDYAYGFYIPVEHLGMFAFPYTGQTSEDGRVLKQYNSAIHFKKTRSNDIIEKSVDAMWLQYSFMFAYHNTPAYQRWIIA